MTTCRFAIWKKPLWWVVQAWFVYLLVRLFLQTIVTGEYHWIWFVSALLLIVAFDAYITIDYDLRCGYADE